MTALFAQIIQELRGETVFFDVTPMYSRFILSERRKRSSGHIKISHYPEKQFIIPFNPLMEMLQNAPGIHTKLFLLVQCEESTNCQQF